MPIPFKAKVSSALVNAQFLDKTIDDITVGVLGLNNTTDANSGNQIFNIQRYINELATLLGVLSEGDATADDYANENYITDGDDRKVVVEKLDAALKVVNDALDALTIIVNCNELNITDSLAIAASGTITATTLTNRQNAEIASSGGAVTLANEPFGTGGTWKDRFEIIVTGTDDTNTVKMLRQDIQYGALINGSFTFKKGATLKLYYSSSMERFIEISRFENV